MRLPTFVCRSVSKITQQELSYRKQIARQLRTQYVEGSKITQQELSYRKQIARQLRTQYVEGIHRPKYYTVTLKYRFTQGNGTIGQIINDLLLVELFDVKYYHDLEM